MSDKEKKARRASAEAMSAAKTLITNYNAAVSSARSLIQKVETDPKWRKWNTDDFIGETKSHLKALDDEACSPNSKQFLDDVSPRALQTLKKDLGDGRFQKESKMFVDAVKPLVAQLTESVEFINTTHSKKGDSAHVA